MTSQGERVPPRGFARYGTGIDGGTTADTPRVLAVAEPALSLVTINPLDRTLDPKEFFLYYHQLYTAAKLEELHHGLYQCSGSIRNLRLLEQQAHHDLFQADLNVAQTKAALVRTEIVCEKLHAEIVELIETHDNFRVSRRLFDNEGSPSQDYLADLYATALGQELQVDLQTVQEVLSEAGVAADRDRDVVNGQIYDEIQWLTEAYDDSFLPQFVVLMALDLPGAVSPFAAPDTPQPSPESPFAFVSEPTVSVDSVDIHARFNQLVDVFRRDTVRQDLAHCDDDQLIAAAVNAVERYSTVDLGDGISGETPATVTLPLLDSVIESTDSFDTFNQRMKEGFLQSVFDSIDDGNFYHAVLLDLMANMYHVFGSVAVGSGIILPNPYVSTTKLDEEYDRVWIREFVARRLVEQLLRNTIDNDASSIQHPLHSFNRGPPIPEFVEGMVVFVRESADAFAEVTVDGEDELRRLRAARSDTVG